ncbi:chemotaxis protein CheW [Leptolyngbya cf. ectocarpi LEGE 11479]|uniref:Chemotaxis protein CheW n=1 Tax=Leptolyngbya cf. ectocarpi LEGE 11479 TaxID=1828722 RepID=A0A929F9Z5_LEPEC|nr:chemotaxis protein CheW [Leptolyngbya ectocarpi]MBE9067839.1 chemotaxis protein CheW [Leptolyngbya cf. ectocarpi LEGE 11479]
MTSSIPVAASLRLIVINIGKLTLACRIETVYKVVNRSAIHSSGLGPTGLTHIDGHTVVVMDLHRKLFNVPITGEPGYFVIINSHGENLVAIPVTAAPNLMDVQREQIRLLPQTYRQSDTLGIASHVTVVPNGEESLTLFILDENALL